MLFHMIMLQMVPCQILLFRRERGLLSSGKYLSGTDDVDHASIGILLDIRYISNQIILVLGSERGYFPVASI